jgi:hypothetical protein
LILIGARSLCSGTITRILLVRSVQLGAIVGAFVSACCVLRRTRPIVGFALLHHRDFRCSEVTIVVLRRIDAHLVAGLKVNALRSTRRSAAIAGIGIGLGLANTSLN